jgi:hypothetical protein
VRGIELGYVAGECERERGGMVKSRTLDLYSSANSGVLRKVKARGPSERGECGRFRPASFPRLLRSPF